nr:hypothetical protein [Klebsiella pneumoniae subsp. pneumoniae]
MTFCAGRRSINGKHNKITTDYRRDQCLQDTAFWRRICISLSSHCLPISAVPREATLVADHLIAANLAGHDSHGVGMIPSYVKSHAGGFRSSTATPR